VTFSYDSSGAYTSNGATLVDQDTFERLSNDTVLYQFYSSTSDGSTDGSEGNGAASDAGTTDSSTDDSEGNGTASDAGTTDSGTGSSEGDSIASEGSTGSSEGNSMTSEGSTGNSEGVDAASEGAASDNSLGGSEGADAASEDTASNDGNGGDGSTDASKTIIYYGNPQTKAQIVANGGFQQTTYYMVSFVYCAGEQSANGDYYTPSASFNPNGGSYGAVLDEANPYKQVADGTGYFKKTGEGYHYVGAGNGTHTLVAQEGAVLTDEVYTSYIYCQGGFSNNDLFKESVFNQSGLLKGNTTFSIRVVVATPEDLGGMSVDDIDLLYISDSSLLGTATNSYGGTNDLSAEQADKIYKAVLNEDIYLPVMLDYGILEETGSNVTASNVYKLAKLLTAQNLSTGNVTLDESKGSWTIADNLAYISDDNHHFVNKNIYVFPKESGTFSIISELQEVFPEVSKQSSSEFLESAKTAGFGDIAEMITEENFYREVENKAQTGTTYKMFDQTISKAIAIEYIISYLNRRQDSENTTINVLDIEPCAVNDTSKTEIEKKIKDMLGIKQDSSYTVSVVHMTSAEFISKVEDLCKYDMIYMGLYTDRMNVINGRTVYNDSEMNGLVYTNIGDYQLVYCEISVLDTDYHDFATRDWYKPVVATNNSADNANRVRYSGNDFTTEKVKNIEDFIKSGSPVVLADNFLTTGADGKTYVYDYPYDNNGNRITSSGNGYIDNCSNVYRLIKDIKITNDNANVMTVSSVTGSKKELLLRYATMGKPELTVDAGAKTAGQNYVTISGRTISFDFTVKNYGSADANATFNCILLADYNADGRYSNTTEKVGANDFRITKNGVSQTVKSGIDDDGTYYYYELSANNDGSSYHVEYDLSEDYIGVLPIKIKVSQSNNNYRYAYEELYFYKANTTGKRQKIKVLQILPSDYSTQYTSYSGTTGHPYEWIFDMDLTGSYETGTDIDPDKYKDCPSKAQRSATEWNNAIKNFKNDPFYQLISENSLQDYELDIDSLYINHYVEFLKNPAAHNNFSLDDYDMLVLGFADSYTLYGSDSDDAKLAAESIQNFIKSGKSVLFTHDTTTYSDFKAMGRIMNKYLCPYVGLDRYGIYSSDLLGYLRRAGIWRIEKDSNKSIDVSDFYSLKQAKAAGLLDKDTYTYSELYDLIVAYAEADQKDVAYTPNKNFQYIDSSVQGRSSMAITNDALYTYMNTNINPGNLPNTHTAELVNEGQILIYPYNILDEMNDGYMSIAQTHGQYYQIDMNEDADADGQSDVTVWLALADDYRTSQQYDLAQKDARNNYYIYTKGNVTYSGVGHTNCNYVGNETEVKLYINTIITAYNAGAHAPDVTIKSGPSASSADLDTVYVGMDSVIDGGAITSETQIDQGTEDVYFSIKDTNVVSGGTKQISLKYYRVFDTQTAAQAAADAMKVEDGAQHTVETLKDGTEVVYGVELSLTTYKETVNSDGTLTDSAADLSKIESGVYYKVEVPYSLVSPKAGEAVATTEATATIRIYATTSITKANATMPLGSYTGYDTFHVQRVNFFNLD
jgi:hypothetical protein